MAVVDTGNRTAFPTGAMRDIPEDKGRCDLLPLNILAEYFKKEHEPDKILENLFNFIYSGNIELLYAVLWYFRRQTYANDSEMFIEVSKHYEQGAKKYAERNWEKGLPLHSFIDSGIRHYLKYLRDDKDEAHDRAFVWNILGCLWTLQHHPELNDLPFAENERNNDEHIPDTGRTTEPTDV